VKCQNLKTQEVVAVKVIKNRTAYFNQSMMEVSVLDLVGFSSQLLRKLLLTWPRLIASSIRMMTIIYCGSEIPSSIGNISA
jgi:hypothetical protein